MTVPVAPQWLRLTAVAAALGTIGVLSLSDRAPRFLIGLLRAVAEALPSGSTAVPSVVASALRSAPGGSDAVGHFALWAVVGLLASSLTSSRLTRFNLLVSLVAVSAVIEIAQALATWSRSASMSDLVANALGVAAGCLAFAVGRRLLAKPTFRSAAH